MGKVCKVDGCNRPVRCKELCSLHYNRKIETGSVGCAQYISQPSGTPWAWLIKNSQYNGDECLIWPFGSASEGYATILKPCGGYTKAHRAMCCIAHGEPRPHDLVAMHSCDNKRCVNPRHLSWGTQKQNAEDAIERGRSPVGENSPKSKITENDVREIRRLRAQGVTYSALEKRFGISKGSIWHVVQGTQWGHVK